MGNLKEEIQNFYEDKTECNIFKILGMQKGSENRHSNFLAWLLNPNESHGLGNKFIKYFFDNIYKSHEIDNNFENVVVDREDSQENGRADIVIKNNEEVICVIEVKFGSKENNNQCKRYYKDYGENCKYIFLDIDEQNYEELSKKYNEQKFKFNEMYKLATFKNHILPILKKIIKPETIKDTPKNINPFIKQIIKQYINLLNEKFYIIDNNEIIKKCREKIIPPNKLEDYTSYKNCNTEEEKLIHNFIWHTVPDKYNEALRKIIKELEYKILLKWKENGSSLSFRFTNVAQNDLDYHDNPHFYLDHRNNKKTLYKQKNLNETTVIEPEQVVSSSEEYFKLPFDKNGYNEEDFYKQLKNKIEEFVKNNPITE